jgi:predicted LPLAT superfamily acyltransferase
VKEPMQWYNNKEVSAGYIRLRLLYSIYKLLGAKALKPLVAAVTFLAFCFAPSQRRAIRKFYTLLYKFTGKPEHKPNIFKIFKNFIAFSYALTERLDAWNGKVSIEMFKFADETFDRLLKSVLSGKGCFILTSHMGNIDVFRALAYHNNFIINTFLDPTHTGEYNKFMQSKLESSFVNIYSTKNIDISTAVIMKEKIERGEIVVMAADRLPSTNKKDIRANFLNAPISLPRGVFKFAAIMECDIYDLNIMKDGKYYNVYTNLYAREDCADSYVKTMEKLAAKYPSQWFNFYDYWRDRIA